MRKILAYVGLSIAVAVVAGAVMLSYSVSRAGQSMSGVIVRYDEAALDVVDQPGTTTTLKIDRVVAPGPSWIVVSQIAMGPTKGMMDKDEKSTPSTAPAPVERVLAVARVGKGELRDVLIPLAAGVPLTRMVSVTLHSDSGVRGTFEFDMNQFAESPDKPYFRQAAPGLDHSPLQLGRGVRVQ
jgi:hypothetical protein